MKTNDITMSSMNPDDLLLLIRCPSCGQRFKVGEDLRGRTVECGGCEYRFRINDDVIVRGKKFYPGERKDPSLNRFHRVPLAMSSATPPVSAVQYVDPPDPVRFEPASPLRILAGAVGVAGMVLMALFLMFGATRGGALDGMTTGNRLLMAGFTGLVGIGFLVFANPRARVKALVIGLLMTAGLMFLPFVFTTGSVPLTDGMAGEWTPSDVATPGAVEGGTGAGDESEMRAIIGTGPLEKEIARLASERSTHKAVGLWLQNLRESNSLLVRDYILRATKADSRPTFYPRGRGSYLVVVTGINLSLDEVARIAGALGKVEEVFPEISVAKVRVNNDVFLSAPIEKLSDRDHPAFYDLNKRELESIDPERVAKAVRRLAEAEPKIYRSDISRKFIALLGEDWVEFKADICHALAVWSNVPGPAGEAALNEARKLRASGDDVPVEMVALIVKENTPGVVPLLDELWSENATRWEALYGDVGSAAEKLLIRRFPSTKGSLRHSAVRLLGRVGGPDSIPLLEAAGDGVDSELDVLIRKAIVSIRARAKQ